MKGSTGELGTVLLSWLSAPLGWGVGMLLLFAALARWQALQSRRGGVLLLAGLLTFFALLASQAAVLEALLVPSRLVVLLFLSLNLLALWLAFHERLGEKEEAPEPRGTLSHHHNAELWVALVVGLGVFVAALFWQVPALPSGEANFFHGEMQLQGILAPWVAKFLVPGLLLATLFALPWLHRPASADKPVEAVPRNAGLIFFGLAWLLLFLVPMAGVAFEGLCGRFGGGPPTDLVDGVPVRTLAQFLWYHVLAMEMPSHWLLRESPGIALLTGYFSLLPFLLPRLRASRGFCRRCQKALGGWRYAVLLALLLTLSLVPLKMMSLWWLGIGAWIAIPELPLHF